MTKKYGKQKSPSYGSFKMMHERCKRKVHKYYYRYGGRGIKVCDRWELFTNFYEDMGKRPSSNHSIDRIDNDGDYTPDNCVWSTRSQQQQNKRPPKNISGYPGVIWDKSRNGGKWLLKKRIDGKYRYFGIESNKEDAIKKMREIDKLIEIQKIEEQDLWNDYQSL